MSREDDDLGSPHEEDMNTRLQGSKSLDLNIEQDCHSPKVTHVNAAESSISSKVDVNADGILKIGTEFASDEHAYKFYNKYARLLGFSVRKDWVNRSKVHGQVVSRKFTCSREGYRRKDRRDVNVKKHRKETRTGCLAHMIITRQPDGKYRITHFEADHNHDNINPNNALPLENELNIGHRAEADLADNMGPQTKSAFESMSRRLGVRESLDYLALDYENHLRSERIRDMKEGEVGRLLHYFQRQHFENPSFFYAIQVDINDKVSNLFWADDNMVLDYDHFGDVVCLDTTCRTNRDFLPFVQFVGVNNHKQVIIFAAALLYDDTVESLKWLFQTFLEVMSRKMPKVVLTDQDAAVIEAMNSVLPGTNHRICVWQMYQNALKHLNHLVKDMESFVNAFRCCIYDHKDEESFIHAWNTMLDKYGLQQNEWLRWMFREREKWAGAWGKNTFFIDMQNTHLCESLSNNMTSYLNSDLDVLQFFKHFERVVDEQRYKETEASEEMNRCMPRLMGNVILLKHAINLYTPKAFEVFQREYEKSLNVVVNHFGEHGSLFEFKANTFGQSQVYTVTFESPDDTVVCSCMMFEHVGFLCCHALKVLDHRNIKVTPSKYILKRWTKDARLGNERDKSDFSIHDNPKFVAASRYKDLCRSLLKLSARAAESEEAFHFAASQLDEVMEGLEKILSLTPKDAQPVTSGSTGANASESEHAEIFLDGNVIEDLDDDNGVEAMEKDRAVPSTAQLINEKGIKTKSVQHVQVPMPDTVACISSPPPAFISPETATSNPVMQGLYNFEANQAVHCMYPQPNLIIDQQPNPNMFQASNFYSNQHESPDQSHLLQEPLIREAYQESIASTSQLRQAMDLDVEHSQSSSFLLYDHRYRSDSPYLGPK